MKKIISVLLIISAFSAVFTACSKDLTDPKSVSATAHASKATTITTDQAKIKDFDAINLIKSYSANELSLTEEQKENCSFMVESAGVEIDGNYYVCVIATVKNEHVDEEGNATFTFDNKGEYYIRYDAKQILKKDLTSDEDKYEEMTVKELP